MPLFFYFLNKYTSGKSQSDLGIFEEHWKATYYVACVPTNHVGAGAPPTLCAEQRGAHSGARSIPARS